MSKIRLQGPHNFGGFSHDGQNYEADEDGVIEVPAHLPTEVLLAHGLKPVVAKGPKKLEPLAKSAKGGADDLPNTDGVIEDADAEKAKPPVKGAKSAKGGAE